MEQLTERVDPLRVQQDLRKTETDMEELHEERFSGSGKGVGGEWRTRARDSGEGRWGSVSGKGKQKSTTGIGASLTSNFRDKEESNNI